MTVNEVSVMNIAIVPIAVSGKWGAMDGEENAKPVILSMRSAALTGMRLLSDRQPPGIVVEGDPDNTDLPLTSIRPYPDGSAWIWLRVNGPLYAKLAYQFGHELGHVVCNSWGPDAMPSRPCQWIEEALVEAFGLRGLTALGKRWFDHPPRPYMADYARNIQPYVDETIGNFREIRDRRNLGVDSRNWFGLSRAELKRVRG